MRQKDEPERDDGDIPPPLEIPWKQISDDALQGIIDDFILREGTDYGREELEHHIKVSRVKKQLENGLIHIIFESESKTVTIVTTRDWKKMSPATRP